MKYIDADKLIKSVDNYREGAKAALNPIDGDADYYRGKIDACKDMQELIADHQKLPFPQSHWKPSEEQMKVLNEVIGDERMEDTAACEKKAEILELLYNDLKKL